MKKENADLLRKQISEARTRLRKMQETKAPAVRSAGVGILIESELDKASLMLSAEAITDRLTDMSEKVAKIEPDELMKMDAALKAQVGDEAAARFYSKTVEAVRALLDQIKVCRDSVAREIAGLKDGTIPNDMAMTEPTAGVDDASPTADTAPAADIGMDPEPESDDLAADISGDEGADLGPEIEPEPALGRDRKDPLAESIDPDKLVLESFAAEMRSTGSAARAARSVAEKFDIDVSDVREIVSEAARVLEEKKKLPKGFVPFKKGGGKEDDADCDKDCDDDKKSDKKDDKKSDKKDDKKSDKKDDDKKSDKKDDKKDDKKGGFVPFKKGDKKDVTESFQPMSFEGWIKAVDRQMKASYALELEAEVGEEDARRLYKASQESGETVQEFIDWYATKYGLDNTNSGW